MIEILKTLNIKGEIAILNLKSRTLRKKERQALKNARQLCGKFSIKHGLDEKHPEMPEKVKRAMAIENSGVKAQEKYEEFWGLSRFRKNNLRKELRSQYLAYAFLRGDAYITIEEKRYTKPDFDRIRDIVSEHSEQNKEDIRVVLQRFEEWVQSASKVE